MDDQETLSVGVAQRDKLAELLAELKRPRPAISIYDIDAEYVFALTIREQVIRLQALAAPILRILSGDTANRLTDITVDELDLDCASKAKAELDAIVPAIEDALENQQGVLLPGSLGQLLKGRKLDTVSEEIDRALLNTVSDPPVAVSASRAALESLLKVYAEDQGLDMKWRTKTANLLGVAMGALGLDPANEKVDRNVQNVLQSLWSVVHGISDLRTNAGAAHGYGRRRYRLQVRHARLAVQASQTFIEFFVETWNHREGRSVSD